MKERPYRPEDREALLVIHAKNDYGFPFPEEDLDSYSVITDDDGKVIMAAGYKLVPEVTILCPQGGITHPAMKLKGIALLHEALRDRLVKKGHRRAFSFLAPKMERSFGRHLSRKFGWVPAWTAYAIKDWRDHA
jgi:hypothetical protein